MFFSAPHTSTVKSSAAIVLAVITCANFLNFLDRQIISILAQSMKADLRLTDAQLGFLMGTAFAVFYSLFGIAMGRIADSVSRTRMMALGLACWSAMTALAGVATSFIGIAATRSGVGVGEAAANPCSASLIAQYFPTERRAGALGIFYAGGFLGAAAALVLGGAILGHWKTVCIDVPLIDACAIADWRATLLILGLPGLFVAAAVVLLREPTRAPASALPLGRLLRTELSSAVPPLTLFTIFQLGGAAALVRNLALVIVLIAAAALASWTTGDRFQWFASALGIYSVCTWAMILRICDRRLYEYTFGSRTFILATLGVALIACIPGGVLAWSAPFAIRVLKMSPGEVGLGLGLTTTIASVISVLIGGRLTDVWKRYDVRAPLWVCLIGLLAPLIPLCAMISAETPRTFLIALFVFILFANIFPAAIASLVQDLVLDNMRGTAISINAMISVLVVSGIGPFWVGKASTLAGSLATGMISITALAPIAATVVILAARSLSAGRALGAGATRQVG
jgi:MFS family permease